MSRHRRILRAATLGAAIALAASAMAAELPAEPAQLAADVATTGFDGVVEAVRQTVIAAWRPGQLPRIEIPGLPAGAATPTRTQLLPTVDAATHTVTVRADLRSGLSGIAPGMFARVWLPVAAPAGAAGNSASITVPQRSIVRRSEMTGLYVLDAGGRPLLRQVRLGRSADGRIEVLAGLSPGERVVTDPQAAARVR